MSTGNRNTIATESSPEFSQKVLTGHAETAGLLHSRGHAALKYAAESTFQQQLVPTKCHSSILPLWGDRRLDDLVVVGLDGTVRSFNDGEQIIAVRRLLMSRITVFGLRELMALMSVEAFGMDILGTESGTWEQAMFDIVHAAEMRKILSSWGIFGDPNVHSVRFERNTIVDYTSDELIWILRMMMFANHEYQREKILYDAARGLGFSRIGCAIRRAFEPVYNYAEALGPLRSERSEVHRLRSRSCENLCVSSGTFRPG